MQRLFIPIFCTAVLALVGCSSSTDNDDGPSCEGSTSCTTASNCALGLTCADGCCVAPTTCSAASCDAGDFCDQDTGACTSITSKCAADGCECFFVDAAGSIAHDGTAPKHTVAAGGALSLKAVLVVSDGGLPLPNPLFSYTSSNAGVAAVNDSTGVVTAGGTAGTVTITADGGANVTPCTAEVVNIGEPPANHVRFYVFDENTGEPIAGAQVIVQDEDTNTDGALDSGPDGVTAATGIATFEGVNNTYNVTVLKDGYNYLSIVGLTSDDVVLPLSPRVAQPDVGGFTGKINFQKFEERFLGGRSKLIKAGIVAASFPLRSILNFDLSLFVGDIATDCSAATASNPVPGCYSVDIAGAGGIVPLPGGLSLGVGGTQIKPNFDTVGFPGRRYAWGFGGEIDLEDLTATLEQVLPLLSCNCDDTPNVCDEGCACDIDCGLNVNFGAVFNDIMPLLGEFAMGNRGNLALEGVTKSDWDTYITDSYAQRDNDARFPKLDGADSFELVEGWRTFTDYTVPNLPADPVNGETMEAMLMLTGVNSVGFGFVPMGLGLALDCTTSNCLNREEHPNDFDGKVNGGVVCKASPNKAEDRCGGQGFPESGTIADGHLGVFRAEAFGGLEGSQWYTVGIAAPVTGFLSEGGAATIRATAFIRHEEPAGAPTNISSETYPAFPTLPAAVAGRVYNATASTGATVHWVTFADDDQALTTRWNVYFPSAGGSFAAPALPGGFVDPLAGDDVDTTHIGFRMQSGSLGDLAAHNGTNLNTLVESLTGFSVQSTRVDVE